MSKQLNALVEKEMQRREARILSRASRVKKLILDAGDEGCLHSHVYRHTAEFPNKSTHLMVMMGCMIALGLVQRFYVPKEIGRPAVVWRGTAKLQEEIAAHKIVAAVLSKDHSDFERCVREVLKFS